MSRLYVVLENGHMKEMDELPEGFDPKVLDGRPYSVLNKSLEEIQKEMNDWKINGPPKWTVHNVERLGRERIVSPTLPKFDKFTHKKTTTTQNA
jgi:hypothetical protein